VRRGVLPWWNVQWVTWYEQCIGGDGGDCSVDDYDRHVEQHHRNQ